MKCPRCGHWNKPSFPRCFQCGEPLRAAETRAPDWKTQFESPAPARTGFVLDDAHPVETDIPAEPPVKPEQDESLAEEMTRLKQRRARGEVYLESFRKNAAEQGIAPSGAGVTVRRGSRFFTDVPEETRQVPPPRGPDRQRRDPMDTFDDLIHEDTGFLPLPDDGGEPEPAYPEDVPPSFDDRMPLAPQPRGKHARRGRDRKRNRRHARGPAAFAVWSVRLIALMAVSGVVWLGVLFLQSRTPPAPPASSADYFIEPIMVDGLPGHRVLIPGQEGTKIYVAELTRSYVVIGGVATIEVADHVFYDTLPFLSSPTMDVKLTPTVVHTGAAEERLAPAAFTIDIPLSPLKVITPESTWTEVSTSIYNLTLQVEPGSRVTVNGNDITDGVNDMGIVTDNPAVKAIGENYISVTARAPYCRENSVVLTLYRKPLQIPLELSPDTLLKTQDKDKEMTIRATTQAGATVTIETPHINLKTENLESTGEFSFTAKMTKVGYNTIRIRASYEGKEDSVLEHTVYYLSPASVYTVEAWALDYNELLTNITTRAKDAQIYECNGVITEILSEKPQLALMNIGTTEKPQPLMLQNETATTWVVGTQYRIYADVSGLYGKMPRLTARYTYKPR